MSRYRVCDALVPNGFGRTFYIGTDSAEAWHKFVSRSAIEPIGGTRGVALMVWNPDGLGGLGAWHTIRRVMPGLAGV